MNRRYLFVLATWLAASGIGACAGQSAAGAAATSEPAPKNPSLITADELTTASVQGNVGDVIRRLRPAWVAQRGSTSFRGLGGTKVSIDGNLLQAPDILDNLQIDAVKEMRLLDAQSAAQRFGNSSGGGKVILITRK